MAAQLDDPCLLNDPTRKYDLSLEDVQRINPNTLNCPMFTTRRDAEINKEIYRRFKILLQEGPDEVNEWQISYLRMFDLTNTSHLFRSREQLLENGFKLHLNRFINGKETYAPLYEAKMVNQYNHRASTYEGIPEDVRFRTHAGTNRLDENALNNPLICPIPRFWIHDNEISQRAGKAKWFLVFRDVISAVADSRSLNSTILPRSAIGNTLPLVLVSSAEYASYLISALNSYVVDYALRQKAVGGHLNYYLFKQLPIPNPIIYQNASKWGENILLGDWVMSRVLELTYTTWDLEPLANECSYMSPPFKWDEDRRFLLRCELDAAFFHLYFGTPEEWQDTGSKELLEYFPSSREAVDYVMETFPIVKKRDIQKHGDFRTKLTISKMYDQMQEAIETGKSYQTWLDPPPGPPTDAEGNFIPMSEWDPDNWPSHVHRLKD